MMNNIKFSEEEQKNSFISSSSNSKDRLFPEVPVFNRSVDLVRLDLVDNSITAIEFKLNKWKKAINQVLQVSISFDYLEICINEPKKEETKNTIIDECKDLGIGVYFFNETSNEFLHPLKPTRVSDTWEIQKRSILNYLKGNNVHA